MAHKAQMNFLKRVRREFPQFFNTSKVLEIGSYNINGTVRDLFKNCDYTGIDVAPGKGVDIVCTGEKYNAPENSFDHCISSECFEHNPEWVATFSNMIRMTRPQGLLIMTCATTGRVEHGTKKTAEHESLTSNIQDWENYYRNLTEEDFRNEFEFDILFERYWFITNIIDCDLYFYGILK